MLMGVLIFKHVYFLKLRLQWPIFMKMCGASLTFWKNHL